MYYNTCKRIITAVLSLFYKKTDVENKKINSFISIASTPTARKQVQKTVNVKDINLKCKGMFTIYLFYLCKLYSQHPYANTTAFVQYAQ